MKSFRFFPFVEVVTLLLVAAAYAPQARAQNGSSNGEKAFLGRWDLTLKAPDREYPSWLDYPPMVIN